MFDVVGQFISDHMEVVCAGGRNGGGKSGARLWQCKLCSFSGGEANVALHINEQHLTPA